MKSNRKVPSRWLRSSFAFAILCAGCLTPPQTPVDVQAAVKRSYPAWSFIGQKTDPKGACPTLDNWDAQPLFKLPYPALAEGVAPQREEESTSADSLSEAAFQPQEFATSRSLEKVQTDMQRFCLYRWKGAEGQARVPSGKIDRLDRFDSDPMAVAISAEPELARMVKPPLSDHFFREVGRAGIPLPIHEDAPKVRLAFLDNFPTTPEGRDHPHGVEDSPPASGCISNHGDFLRLLGRVMTCDDENCATEIWSRLALAYRGFNPDNQELTERREDCGGYFGNLGELAQAIRDEVQAWQRQTQRQQEQKKKTSPLVLNLSLGWDGSLFGGIDKNGENVPFCNLSSGQRAVYDALEEAHLLGALVFAATGNDRGGPVPLKGPLLPAAWERITPGEADACEGVARDYSLVHAVGALRSDDRPLANAERLGAMPSLAAYGDHAALGAYGPYWQTGTYTGTSVATAIVSSTAAVIWHANPALEAAEVVEILRGTPLIPNLDASFWSPSTATITGPLSVHRVSLCSALQRASNSSGFCCSPPKSSPPLLSHLFNMPPGERWPRLEPIPIAKCWRADDGGPPHERSDPLLREGDIPCPSNTLLDLGSIPATHPQPGNDPCPNCTDPPRRAATLAMLSGSTEHVLYLEISPNWPEDRELVSATVEINPPGAPSYSYFIRGPFPRGQAREVILPGEIFPFGPETKTMISWRILIDGVSYSLRTPVFIAN